MSLDEEVSALYSFKASLLNKRKSRKNRQRKGKEEGEREKAETAWSYDTTKGKNSSLRTSVKIRCISVVLPPS